MLPSIVGFLIFTKKVEGKSDSVLAAFESLHIEFSIVLMKAILICFIDDVAH